MTFKSIKAGVAALVLLAVPFASQAAELPMRSPNYKAPIYKAPPPVVATWTGCYVGANAGYGMAPTKWSDASGNFASHTANGMVGGGQFGCDYQKGQLVFGVQGMFDVAGMNGESHRILGALGPNIIDQTHVSWFGTLTGRIGYAVQPETLLYIKAGAAWVHGKYNECCLPPAPPQTSDDGFAKATRLGGTVGLGVEHMLLPHWSVFFEYDYIGLGTHATTFTPTPPTTAPFVYNIKQDVHTVLAGVNYRF